MYEDRFYRAWADAGSLHRFEVRVQESDLLVVSDRDDREGVRATVAAARKQIEAVIRSEPAFATSLEPLDVPADAPTLVRDMAAAGRFWSVGPMAAVAGAVSEAVGRYLHEQGARVILVENGGDIYGRSPEPVHFALYAGAASPFADQLAFRLDAAAGVGVCTSSGKVGPSLSLGQADAVVAIHPSTPFADAAATAIANRIRAPEDVAPVVEAERERGALTGLIACMGDQLGLFGELELMKR